MSFAKRMLPEPPIAASAAVAPPPNSQQPAEIVESLIVDLLTEAQRQLAQLSASNTGSDTDDDRQNRENVGLRAINARTLASIVEIVRKVMDLQLQLEQMVRISPAGKVGSARESLQGKIAGIVAELGTRGLPAGPDERRHGGIWGQAP